MLETVRPNVALKRMEGFRVAYVQHRGPPAEIGLAFRKLLQLLHEWRIRPVGPPMAIHYREPGEREDAQSWSEAAVPIAEWTKPHNEVRTKAMPTCEVASFIFDGPPSRFVRAPTTAFANATADDSAHATWSPKFGRWPTRYGVHENVGSTPIRR